MQAAAAANASAVAHAVQQQPQAAPGVSQDEQRFATLLRFLRGLPNQITNQCMPLVRNVNAESHLIKEKHTALVSGVRRLKRQWARVVCVGEAGAGKSAVVNALCARTVLPSRMADEAVTSAMCFLRRRLASAACSADNSAPPSASTGGRTDGAADDRAAGDARDSDSVDDDNDDDDDDDDDDDAMDVADEDDFPGSQREIGHTTYTVRLCTNSNASGVTHTLNSETECAKFVECSMANSAVVEMHIEGPFALPRGIELVDVPGFRDKPHDEERVSKVLRSAAAVMMVTARRPMADQLTRVLSYALCGRKPTNLPTLVAAFFEGEPPSDETIEARQRRREGRLVLLRQEVETAAASAVVGLRDPLPVMNILPALQTARVEVLYRDGIEKSSLRAEFSAMRTQLLETVLRNALESQCSGLLQDYIAFIVAVRAMARALLSGNARAAKMLAAAGTRTPLRQRRLSVPTAQAQAPAVASGSIDAFAPMRVKLQRLSRLVVRLITKKGTQLVLPHELENEACEFAGKVAKVMDRVDPGNLLGENTDDYTNDEARSKHEEMLSVAGSKIAELIRPIITSQLEDLESVTVKMLAMSFDKRGRLVRLSSVPSLVTSLAVANAATDGMDVDPSGDNSAGDDQYAELVDDDDDEDDAGTVGDADETLGSDVDGAVTLSEDGGEPTPSPAGKRGVASGAAAVVQPAKRVAAAARATYDSNDDMTHDFQQILRFRFQSMSLEAVDDALLAFKETFRLPMTPQTVKEALASAWKSARARVLAVLKDLDKKLLPEDLVVNSNTAAARTAVQSLVAWTQSQSRETGKLADAMFLQARRRGPRGAPRSLAVSAPLSGAVAEPSAGASAFTVQSVRMRKQPPTFEEWCQSQGVAVTVGSSDTDEQSEHEAQAPALRQPEWKVIVEVDPAPPPSTTPVSSVRSVRSASNASAVTGSVVMRERAAREALLLLDSREPGMLVATLDAARLVNVHATAATFNELRSAPCVQPVNKQVGRVLQPVFVFEAATATRPVVMQGASAWAPFDAIDATNKQVRHVVVFVVRADRGLVELAVEELRRRRKAAADAKVDFRVFLLVVEAGMSFPAYHYVAAHEAAHAVATHVGFAMWWSMPFWAAAAHEFVQQVIGTRRCTWSRLFYYSQLVLSGLLESQLMEARETLDVHRGVISRNLVSEALADQSDQLARNKWLDADLSTIENWLLEAAQDIGQLPLASERRVKLQTVLDEIYRKTEASRRVAVVSLLQHSYLIMENVRISAANHHLLLRRKAESGAQMVVLHSVHAARRVPFLTAMTLTHTKDATEASRLDLSAWTRAQKLILGRLASAGLCNLCSYQFGHEKYRTVKEQ